MTISHGPFLLPIHFSMLFFLWEIVELLSNYLLEKKYCKYKYEVFLSFVNTYFQKLASLEKKNQTNKKFKISEKNDNCTLGADNISSKHPLGKQLRWVRIKRR